jgi:gliding motility-associated-like protein
MRFIFLLVFSVVSTVGKCQKEATFWYFGNMKADFRATPPSLSFNPSMFQLEGTTTISSGTGELLFYSDGLSLWNREDRITPNGTGLLGQFSSTQSAMFVPKPGNPDQFYLFTVDAGLYIDKNVEGLRYSLVSLCEDFGRGDIVANQKNVLLVKPTTEKLNSTFHANGTDVWVLTRLLGSNEFYSYLVTENGVNHTPVISQAGAVIPYDEINGSNVIGQMKFSPDGTKIAMVTYLGDTEGFGDIGSLRVFGFDNTNGRVSDLGIRTFVNTPYGCEFSPDGTKVYVSWLNSKRVNQYDLNTISESQSTFVTLLRENGQGEQTQQLQLASDGKIYSSDFDVITSPDTKGIGCGFVPLANPPGVGVGTPNFNQSYFDPTPRIVHDTPCDGEFSFALTSPQTVTSVTWDFGDPSSGTGNSSSDKMPKHQFSHPGVYEVKASISYGGGKTKERRKKIIYETFDIDLGRDTLLCDQPTYFLSALQDEQACYSWQDGSTLPTYTVTQSGIYWVDVRRRGCVKRDSIKVDLKITPIVDLGPDQYLCEESSLRLESNVSAESLRWSTGRGEASVEIDAPGRYWLRAANGRCVSADTVLVKLQLLPILDLPTEATFCSGRGISFDFNQEGVTYDWSNGITNGWITISDEGIYWVDAKINGCEVRDSVQVMEIRNIERTRIDTLICKGTEVVLDFSRPATNYEWSTGEVGSIGVLDLDGLTTVIVSNTCYTERIDIFIASENCSCEIFVPNVFTPNSDGLNDTFGPVWHQNIASIDFRIYNRWGTEVFSTQNKNMFWKADGQISSGVYYWSASYNCKETGNIVFKKKQGNVSLLR